MVFQIAELMKNAVLSIWDMLDSIFVAIGFTGGLQIVFISLLFFALVFRFFMFPLVGGNFRINSSGPSDDISVDEGSDNGND